MILQNIHTEEFLPLKITKKGEKGMTKSFVFVEFYLFFDLRVDSQINL